MDGGILISYRDPADYNRTINAARDKLCQAPAMGNPSFRVTKHRTTSTMGLYCVAIFDENGDSAIDLYLTASNFYIVGFRRPELKWVVCENQIGEQKALGGEFGILADFGSSYANLGVSASNTALMRLTQCSTHVNALVTYYDAVFSGNLGQTSDPAKSALAYFAATIAEAIRFRVVQEDAAGGRLSFAGQIELLQHWMGWSMRPDSQVSRAFSVVPVHESIKNGGEFANNLEDAKTYFTTDDFVLRFDDRAGGSADLIRNFCDLTGNFSLRSGDRAIACGTVKKRMIDFYCRSRIDARVGERLLTNLRKHKGNDLKNEHSINGFFVKV